MLGCLIGDEKSPLPKVAFDVIGVHLDLAPAPFASLVLRITEVACSLSYGCYELSWNVLTFGGRSGIVGRGS